MLRRTTSDEWLRQVNEASDESFLAAAPVRRWVKPPGLGSIVLNDLGSFVEVIVTAKVMVLSALTALFLSSERSRMRPPDPSAWEQSKRSTMIAAVGTDQFAWFRQDAPRAAPVMHEVMTLREADVLFRKEPHGRDYQLQVQRQLWIIAARHGAEFARRASHLPG